MTKMMRKALLADDDQLSRNYLKLLSAWSEAGFEIQADVQNGEEALSVLENEAIDLLVTDLEMPRMGGLQLIRALRERGQTVYILVLSRRSEIDCVREAMEAGADCCLLKSSLNGVSLYAALCGANARINARDKELRTAAGFAQKRADMLAAEKYFYFSALLADTLKGAERERRRLELGLQEFQQDCAVMVLRPERETTGDPLAEARAEHERLAVLSALQDKLKESGFPGGRSEVIYFAGTFCCFLDFSGIDTGSEIHSLLTRPASILQRLCREAGLPCVVGMSSLCIGTDAVREAYRQASEVLERCFYKHNGIALYEGAVEISRALPQEAKDMLDRVENLRFRHDREGFRQCGAEAAEAFRQERTARALVLQWLQTLLRVCGLTGDISLPPLMTIEELQPLLDQIERQYFQGQTSDKPKKLSLPVQKAANFALEHFREQIGLNDAAAAAGVNSSYLSARFSREMGVGYANYLLGLRLSCAERLLGESEISLHGVAKRAGFRDYHYFYKVFKRRNGVTPAEYRALREDEAT